MRAQEAVPAGNSIAYWIGNPFGESRSINGRQRPPCASPSMRCSWRWSS